ncbi:MAG TPA: sensor histidine kinase [Opitutaceae bacterium]|nr:sensor histidine kinase [Opitutaceae bacterium]
MQDPRTEAERIGARYGAFAFASIIISCFAGFYFNQRMYFNNAAAVPLTFGLGAAYATIGILGGAWIDSRTRPLYGAVYYIVQCAVLTAMVVYSPIRGFFGMIVLPVASQSIFDLRARWSTLVCLYLFALNVGVWAGPFGWSGAMQAVLNYSAGFAFTILFSIITKQALLARDREEGLRRELETANAQLRAHAAQAEELATTRERNRVAREIHDGVGHYLTVVKTQLDAAAALLPSDPGRARDAVDKAARLTHDALEDVRRSVGTLRADAPRPPLPEVLRALAADASPVPDLRVEGIPRPLAAAAEHALFRSAQEGLTNLRKHARATAATLTLDFRDPRRVRLELADNGVGGNGPQPGGFGLRGLRERTEVLGGRMDAGPGPAGGFRLAVELPS